jgi:ppGpp synthetase/RelA/SpoT-type nucleotidyltranferase
VPDYLALLLSSESDKAATSILDQLRRTGVTSDCYAIKYRVKSKEDLLEKLQRKTAKKADYEIYDITDVIGVRLVTLYKGDMLMVYRRLIELLSSPNNGSPILHSAPEEIIIYRGTSLRDDVPKEIQRTTKIHFKHADVKVVTSQEGYSSIHVICRLANPLTDQRLQQLQIQYSLPIEIQIRTVFEDAWGEIDHKYGYVHREGKSTGTPVPNAHLIKAHLQSLKGFTDACMEYAECIRNDAQPEKLDPAAGAARTISVPSDDDILERFRRNHINEELITRYSEARSERTRAAALVDTNSSRDQINSAYLQAAELFRGLAHDVAQGHTISNLKDGTRLFYYYSAMNEALCLLSTNQPDHINAAIEIYRPLENHYKKYSLVKVRMGQALSRIGQIDEAITSLRQADEMFAKQSQLAHESGKWEDHLPKTDHDHIHLTLPKVLGFVLWRKTQATPPLGAIEKAELYFEALKTTERCLTVIKGDPKKEREIHNNLLYYCVGFVSCAAAGNPELPVVTSMIPALLETFSAEAGDVNTMGVEDLDTIFHAHAHLEKPDSQHLAQTLIRRCLEPTVNLTLELCMKMAQDAQTYLNTGKLPTM